MKNGRPHIVINALSARTGGGVTYAVNLLRHLEPDFPADVSVLVAPQRRELLPDGPHRFIDCPGPGRSVVHRTLWERVGLPRLLARLSADVYYPLSGLLPAPPPEGCRSVVAFRNLLPFSPQWRRRYPPGYIRLRLWLLRRALAPSFARADLLIFISEHGRRVIETSVPQRRGRSVVIPHGVGEVFTREAPGEAWRERWPRGYVLYASILDVYKAQIEVVEAWALVRARRETPERLVLAGPEFGPYGRRLRRRIAELGLGEEVVLLGPVPHDRLPGLYQHAVLNVFASRLENCPNILLETLASGRAVACSSDPPMPEFGADAVAYFDPSRPPELAALLCELLDDGERRRELGARARKRARDFGLAASASRTWASLLELAREPRTLR